MLLNTKINKSLPSGATLLWTNPTDTYTEGVVQLAEGYQYLVEFRMAYAGEITNPIALLSNTETPFYFCCQVRNTYPGLGWSGGRLINYVRAGEISFGKAYYADGGTDDRYKYAPLRIWGVK